MKIMILDIKITPAYIYEILKEYYVDNTCHS